MFYAFVRSAVLLFYRVLFLFKATGRENVPEAGALIICANHTSNWDPPTLAAALNRRLTFMAKAELMKIPVFGGIIRALGAHPIRRGKGDSAAVKTAISLLKNQNAMVIFPEGTRVRGQMPKDAGKGVVRLALMTGAAIVPVGIRGKYRPFGRVSAKIGEPIFYDEYMGAKIGEEELSLLAKNLMEKIYALAGGGE